MANLNAYFDLSMFILIIRFELKILFEYLGYYDWPQLQIKLYITEDGFILP